MRAGTWLCLIVVWLAVASGAGARAAVPRVEYANPIAGLALTIPEDWEMATGDLGNVLISMDAPSNPGLAGDLPALNFFYTKSAPEQAARDLARALEALDHSGPQCRQLPSGTWEVTATSDGPRGPLQERWLFRSQAGLHYAIGSLVRPRLAAQYAEDLTTALTTCRLIHRPAVQKFLEPTENAYRMAFPQGWRWEGQILRAENVPGYFTWKVQSPDGTQGAFSAPPGVFNIAVPYLPAHECAQSIILPALQQQYPGMRLDRVHELPRVGQYFEAQLRAWGLGANPQVDKCRADYTCTLNGTRVRLRADLVTLMLDASPLLGGRGNWMLLTSGAWAPAESFAEQYPVGRGVVASLRTDPQFRNAQFEAVNEVLIWRNWWRALNNFDFVLNYLEMEDTLNPPPKPPDDDPDGGNGPGDGDGPNGNDE